MTKEITKAIILQEMQDKLKLREFDPSKFLFDETVVPTYNIEPHLEHWKQLYTGGTITGTGGKLFHIVPANERWQFSRYDVVFMSGAYTVAGVYIVRMDKTPGDALNYLDLTAAQTISYHIELPHDVVLQSNDAIFINVDGFTSSGTLRLYIDYMVEELR